jgi:hypothetical protein
MNIGGQTSVTEFPYSIPSHYTTLAYITAGNARLRPIRGP